ncbi:MAG TPA: hypothetical protein VFS54_07650 [Solirubrobacterales bacterium]|nr:hypothetical protein [Solirubrobacterales bacterium]
MKKASVNKDGFNAALKLPYALRPDVFAIAMEDIYELLFNLNTGLVKRGLLPFENSVRGAVYSGMLSDLLTEAVASHAKGLVKNRAHNGHPDLLPAGRYSGDAIPSAKAGVEVKVTKKKNGAVDMHSDRPAYYCVFRYEADYETEPVVDRSPTRFTDIWLAKLDAGDFRKNNRGPRGTRTATAHREGLKKLRKHWLYSDR